MTNKMFRVSEQDVAGMALRLAVLSTQYRKDYDFTKKQLSACAKIYRRWLHAAIPCDERAPLPVLEALCDDLNTPAAIAAMHVLARTDGKGLFASMLLLGLLPDHPRAIAYDIVDGVKTLPLEAIPLLEWPEGSAGFATMNGPNNNV